MARKILKKYSTIYVIVAPDMTYMTELRTNSLAWNLTFLRRTSYFVAHLFSCFMRSFARRI